MKKRDLYIEKIFNLLNDENIAEDLTMKDIADLLGVTKMTLYNNFKDKNDMLDAVINYRSIKYQEFLSSLTQGDMNAIEDLMCVLRFQKNNPIPFISKIHKSIFINNPDKFSIYYNNFKYSLNKFISDNIEQGQKQGLYREDLDPTQISLYLITTVEGMFDKIVKNNGSQIDLAEMHRDIILYHLRGIISKKGAKLLEEMHKAL